MNTVRRAMVIGLVLRAGILLPLVGCGETEVKRDTPAVAPALPTPDGGMMKGAPRPK